VPPTNIHYGKHKNALWKTKKCIMENPKMHYGKSKNALWKPCNCHKKHPHNTFRKQQVVIYGKLLAAAISNLRKTEK
jgi:hypothetical protein